MAKNEFKLNEELKKLEQIQVYFQSNQLDLDEALKQQKQAVEITGKILKYLEEAENEIITI